MDKCSLCYGDGWITDQIGNYVLCVGDEEVRFMERMGNGRGAAEGRIACPRCQPNWKPARSQSGGDKR